jgi:ParB-like chromosome segregation protein Spo0J
MQSEGRTAQTKPALPWRFEMLAPSSLRPAKRNGRTHSKKQIRHIAESTLRFGVINPVIVDGRGWARTKELHETGASN